MPNALGAGDDQRGGLFSRLGLDFEADPGAVGAAIDQVTVLEKGAHEIGNLWGVVAPLAP